ncbi:MAG TPA: hypothetical protein VHC49_26265 [Mycobacteriales bacterium]|nr:hypothetical protein [Mycobacteriales bacterium]
MTEGTPSPIAAEDVAGTIAARQALGADNEQAVIAAFLERTGQAIDARVDAHLAVGAALRPAAQPARPEPKRPRDPGSLALAIVSMVIAIPLTGIATQFDGVTAVVMLVAAWVGIVAVNLAYNRRG